MITFVDNLIIDSDNYVIAELTFGSNDVYYFCPEPNKEFTIVELEAIIERMKELSK
jgi:hypothetical protein